MLNGLLHFADDFLLIIGEPDEKMMQKLYEMSQIIGLNVNRTKIMSPYIKYPFNYEKCGRIFVGK